MDVGRFISISDLDARVPDHWVRNLKSVLLHYTPS